MSNRLSEGDFSRRRPEAGGVTEFMTVHDRLEP
jgi:hypothetical protein